MPEGCSEVMFEVQPVLPSSISDKSGTRKQEYSPGGRSTAVATQAPLGVTTAGERWPQEAIVEMTSELKHPQSNCRLLPPLIL